VYRNKYMRERLRRLDKEAEKMPKRTAEEAYAQYDRQNGIVRSEVKLPEREKGKP